jgi:hypothetical protein
MNMPEYETDEGVPRLIVGFADVGRPYDARKELRKLLQEIAREELRSPTELSALLRQLSKAT